MTKEQIMMKQFRNIVLKARASQNFILI